LISAPAEPTPRPPAWNDSTAGVVSDGLKRFSDSSTLRRSGDVSRPNGIAHGTRTWVVERAPISIAPSAGGAVPGVPAKDALTRIVIWPPGRSRKRSGEAWSARPA